MQKSEDRRAAILDLLVDHVLASGLAASSLRSLADAAQTSDRMLLYYFTDKAEIIAATLERMSNRLVAVLDQEKAPAPLPRPELLARLHGVILADELWPYMRVFLEVASLSAGGDAFYRAVAERIGRAFLEWGACQLDSPTPRARKKDAALLMVTLEGMIMLKSIGLEDVCRDAL